MSERKNIQLPRIRVSDIMTETVESVNDDEPVSSVIEQLAALHIGALLIINHHGEPAGVVSKTDLTLAFCRQVPLSAKVRSVMKSPVQCCQGDLSLEEGIRKMIFGEISRLFVLSQNSISGIFTLSDAARARSGSCRKCNSARMTIEDNG